MTQPESSAAAVILRQLGRREYTSVWRAMQNFTARRDTLTPDEFWLVEHPPVYTQGLSGKAENILNPGEIPVIQIDRGGQVTYHGPGQMVLYVLLDLTRRRLGVKDLVRLMEGAVIDTLGEYRILAARRDGAPGVYVKGAKVAALGLRVKRGCSYHGLSLNIDMDLTPFGGIHPCGLKGTPVTQLRELGIDADKDRVAARVIDRLRVALGFDQLQLDPSAPSDLEMMQEPDAT